MTLPCSARGRPNPQLIWLHEDERTFLLPGDRTETLEVSTGDGSLTVLSSYANSAEFVCIVVNEVGAATARAEVRVERGGDESPGENLINYIGMAPI